MALNPSTNATMTGRVTAPDANYPYGSSQDETSPGAGDGTPYFEGRANDIFGFQQWLLDQASIVPSGNADTIVASDYGDAINFLLANILQPKGLILSNNGGDPNDDIDISTGITADSTGTILLRLSTGLTKQLNATWAVGDNAGGLFSGSKAADTWYAVHIIQKDSDGTIDAGFDTSAIAANIPGGYTAFRRIGWILTDSSGNILAFTDTEIAGGQVIREWAERIVDVDSTAGGTVRQTPAVSAPPDEIARLISQLVSSSTINAWLASTDFVDVAATDANADVTVSTTSTHSHTEKEIVVDSSSNIAYRFNATPNTSFRIITLGYTDRRIS